MKRLIKETIDGFDVVTAVAQATVNPVATMRVVAEKLSNSEPYKQYQNAAIEYRSKLKTYLEAKSQIDKTAGKKKIKSPDYESIRPLWDEMIAAEETVKIKIKALNDLKKDLELNNVVYFGVRETEELVPDHEAEKIHSTLNRPGTASLRDGTSIADMRGKSHWKKDGKNWIKTTILTLGEEPQEGDTLEENLTHEQREEIAIQNMSASDIAVMKKNMISELKTRASLMYAELDFDGDPDAKSKAKQWLEAEKAKVNAKFGE